MADKETIEKVYAAIGTLRARGVSQLDVSLVASTAGVARSTLYLDDNDWKEVRAVIKGKPSEKVKLVQIKVEEKSFAAREVESLSTRVAEAEEKISHIESTAEKVYLELIDEVQKWFVAASEVPTKRAKTTQIINELHGTRKELERVRTENRLLKARVDHAGVVRPLIQKNIIGLDVLDSPGEMFGSFLRQLDALIPQRGISHGITSVYLMCGLPFSGKTYWIDKHQPISPGVHLYVDSCAHTADVRRFIAERVRETVKVDVHCVWVRASDFTCIRRLASTIVGVNASLKESEIKKISLTFEVPTLDEPFNSFLIV